MLGLCFKIFYVSNRERLGVCNRVRLLNVQMAQPLSDKYAGDQDASLNWSQNITWL